MSNKKRKHRSKPSSSPYNRSQGSVLADEQQRNEKKFNPMARNLLLTDLVVLALAYLGEQLELLSPVIVGAITILGAVLLLVALYCQFGGGGKQNRGNRLGK